MMPQDMQKVSKDSCSQTWKGFPTYCYNLSFIMSTILKNDKQENIVSLSRPSPSLFNYDLIFRK